MTTTPPTPAQLRELIGVLASARDFALTLELDEPTLEHDFTQICSYAQRTGRARLFGLSPILTTDLGPVVGGALEFDFDRVRTLASDLDREVASAPTFNHFGVFDRGCVLKLAQELAELADVAYAQTTALMSPANDRSADPVAHLRRTARWLAAATTWLLPISHQARYAEEFAAELWELAQAGGGWWRQNAHASRLLIGGMRLRGELNASNRDRAVS